LYLNAYLKEFIKLQALPEQKAVKIEEGVKPSMSTTINQMLLGQSCASTSSTSTSSATLDDTINSVVSGSSIVVANKENSSKEKKTWKKPRLNVKDTSSSKVKVKKSPSNKIEKRGRKSKEWYAENGKTPPNYSKNKKKKPILFSETKDKQEFRPSVEKVVFVDSASIAPVSTPTGVKCITVRLKYYYYWI
jgi:hypothetical protein